MVSTLPDILDAKDEESYAGSIERLLSVLDDPGTYVTQSIPENTLPTDFLEPVTSWTADSILVVPLNENTLDLRDYVMVFQRLSEVLSEVQSNSSNVKGIVFDMRSERGLPKDPEPLEVLIQYSGLENALAATSLVVPGQRSRVHNGFAQEAPVDTDYSSSFYVTNSRLIEPNSTGNISPFVFLVNQFGQLPSIALALQDAGIAAIVSEGHFSGGGLISTHPIEIGENHIVHVRTSELARTDGTTGFDADLTINKSKDVNDLDGSLDQALKLVRNFDLPKTTNQKLPPSAVNQWNTLSKDLYPSRPERILAAFKVWYVIKHFFPYHNLLDRDWDTVFRESLPNI
ncbi:MAG: hypothetical protein KTR29_17215, partial [Rhodothermaceae bacterium]|nr:hypothetical protein [Rhodothermaceae bacterium]